MTSLRLIITTAILSVVCICTQARKVALRLKVPQSRQNEMVHLPPGEVLDSAMLVATADSIRFAGFEKNASSTVESFFVTNNSPLAIRRRTLRITCRDLQGRMLHRREEDIDLDLPQDETRRVSLKSFDLQKNLYYFRSNPPRRGGMPFTVEIEVTGIWRCL